MRSATSNTCGMLWLIRITGRPRSRTSRISCSTRLPSLTPSAAVGSSRMTTLLPNAADRATATACRWPPDSDSTGLADVLQGGDAQLAHVPLGLGPHVLAVQHPEHRAQRRPACAPPGRGTGCRRCPGRARPRGSGRRSRCRPPGRPSGCGSAPAAPSRQISPLSGTSAPDSALIRLDLPAPLSPITARISPGYSSRSLLVDRDHPAVPLGQALGLQHGIGLAPVRTPSVAGRQWRSCLHLPDPLVDATRRRAPAGRSRSPARPPRRRPVAGRCGRRRRSARRSACRSRRRGRRTGWCRRARRR